MQLELTSSKIDQTHEHIKKYQTPSCSNVSLASHEIIVSIQGVVHIARPLALVLLNACVTACYKFAAN